jgi:hypothetical protein
MSLMRKELGSYIPEDGVGGDGGRVEYCPQLSSEIWQADMSQQHGYISVYTALCGYIVGSSIVLQAGKLRI